jgi:hypothetical protein
MRDATEAASLGLEGVNGCLHHVGEWATNAIELCQGSKNGVGSAVSGSKVVVRSVVGWSYS